MAPRAVSGRHASRSDRAVSPFQSSTRRMREDRERERETRSSAEDAESPGLLEPFRVRARFSGGAPL